MRTPAPTLQLAVLIARWRSRRGTLRAEPLRRRRLRRGHELNPRLKVGIDLHDADLGNLRGRDAGAARAAAKPRAPGRDAGGRADRGGGREPFARLQGRLRLGLARLLGRRRHRGRRRGRRRRLTAQFHLIGAVGFLGEVDDLGVMRLAQQLREALRLKRLRLPPFELNHRFAQRFGGHGRVAAAQAGERLAQQAECLTQREATRPAAPAVFATPTAAARVAGPLLARRLHRTTTDRLRRGPGDPRTEGDLVLAVVQLGEVDEALVGGFHHKLGEAREPNVLLVERGVDLLHHLFQPVGPHDVVVRRHLLHGLDHELPGIVPFVGDVGLLGEPGQLVVRVVLVAVLDQQVARRLADPHADDVFPVLLELEDPRGG